VGVGQRTAHAEIAHAKIKGVNPLSLETQVELLRRDLKRQKLTTIALLIGGLLAVSATRVVSQNNSREMTLRALKIVGADGKTKVLISGDAAVNKDGGAIAIFDNKENARVGIIADAKGGNLSILREDSEPMAILGYDGEGGSLGLSANGSKTQVNVAATKDVSGLVVSGPNGKEHIVAGTDKTGGVVELYDFSGKLKKRMP
jgi:hypothetical protein